MVWQATEEHGKADENTALNGISCIAELVALHSCLAFFLDHGAARIDLCTLLWCLVCCAALDAQLACIRVK